MIGGNPQRGKIKNYISHQAATEGFAYARADGKRANGATIWGIVAP